MSAEEWRTAQQVCTPKQLEALDWWRRGAGYKRIAIILGIPRDAARGRVDRGLRRTIAELERKAA